MPDAEPQAGSAPVGAVTLVFTDVEGSTPLWERRPDAIRSALEIHEQIMRDALAIHGGYEMRTEGDAFKAAFADPIAAVRWCMDVQRELNSAQWPAALLEDAVAGEVEIDGTAVLRGLRVRMGVHSGWPEARVHPTTGRMDYDGPMVNSTARIAAAPAGGQVVVSEVVWKTVGHVMGELLVRDLGEYTLRGVSQPVRLFQVLPPELAGRSFEALNLTPTAGSDDQRVRGRRLVSVLHAQIDGPPETAPMLGVVTDELAAAAGELEGVVQSTAECAFTVTFGAQRAREDDAERAVRTALSLRHLFGPLRTMVSDAHGAPPTLGLGIATVDEDASTASASGDAARTAASLALPDRITVAPVTRFLLGRMLRGDERDDGSLTLDAFDASASTRGVPGLSSPMVGRALEMERLMRRASGLSAGQGGVVVITGEPGAGKSRLASELHEGLANTVEWLEGRCPATERSPYAPFAQALRSLLGLGGSDVGVVARTKLRAALRGLGDTQTDRLAPAIASLLGIDLGSGWTPPEPTAVGGLIAEAMRELITRAGPTVLLVDDLHWIDAASLELLTTLTQLTDVVPLLVLVTMRPEADTPAWDYALDVARTYRHRHDEIRVQALEREDAERLTRNLLDLAAIPADLHRVVLDRCGGNPLFLEEVLRTLVQRGTIVRDGGAWNVVSSPEALEIPTTVRGVVDARIDGLPEPVREALQHAAVLGTSFDRATLSALMGAPDDLDRCLGYLQRVDLIRQHLGARGLEYVFKAALTRESAYARIPDAVRRDLHRRAATEIEHRAPDPLGERAAAVAHHYQRAGDAQKAIHHAFRAVQRADQLFAREQAVREYWRILDLLARVERTEQARTWRVDAVLGLLSWPAWARNEQERERGLAELDVAIETARERGDSALLARLEATRGQRLQDEAAFERALSHARNADDHSVEAVARGRYGDFLGSLGYYERAFEHIERAIDLHGDAGDERSQAMSMVSVGRCYCARAGRLEQSLAYAKRAREIGEQLDDPTLLAWGAMEAEPRMYLGQWDAVIRVFEAGMPHAIETGARWPLLFGSAWAAIAYVQQGRPDDAESVLQRAEEVGEAHAGTTFPMIYVRIARARLELARGNLEPARRAAESALALARGGHYRLDEGAALRVLARVRAAAGDDDAARDAFEASLDLLRELESRPELGQTLLRYGEFLKEHHADRGSELIEEAVGIFEATGATGWLQRARAASD